jgi:hypothetical protein
VAVWENHLLPVLMRKDGARLQCTCKALRDLVREHFAGDLGTVTTCPRARHVTLESYDYKYQGEEALIQWLRGGGRGRHLEGLTAHSTSGFGRDSVNRALQEGALPSLKGFDANLRQEICRASLTRGLLGAVHELRLTVDARDLEHYLQLVEPQLAALGLVRQLPTLSELTVEVYGGVADPLQWPPFIPPSLKALRTDDKPSDGPLVVDFSVLLCAFPGTLRASGARLDRLEVLTPFDFEVTDDGLVHLAEALR